MSKIGIIYCAYNTREYVCPSLWPWVNIQYKEGTPEIVICAVNVRFARFNADVEDGTREMLRGYLERGEIDYLIDGPDNIPETTARGMALHWLKDQGCDATWMVDSDEFYTIPEIGRILTFVSNNPWSTWFRLSLKNYVFDDRTYLADPFTPPRIHRIRLRGYEAHSFSADNDIQYGGIITRDIIPQDQFPSMIVPKEVAWVKHLTWQNNLRSKKKIEYQLKGRGWPQCSFSWDDSKGGLIFNPALPTPKTYTE